MTTADARDTPMAAFRCRSCQSHALVPVLSLGETPLANALVTPGHLPADEPRFPLDVVFCSGCTLVQLTQTIPPDRLFREYVYFSSFSDAAVQHARQLVDRIRDERPLGPEHLVVEVASNDGYLLQHYRDAGVPVLGIEPARNVAAAAIARGIETVPAFFTADLASNLSAEGRQADVIHANNVLAHVPDLNGFAEGLRQLLKPRGTIVIEVPWVRELVRHVEFDTIYHEHLSYFSLLALSSLFSRHRLAIVDVEPVAIHGGSLRVWLGHEGETAPAPRVEEMLALERSEGLAAVEYYTAFGDDVARLGSELRALLEQLKRQGHRIAAYGASAKGSTLLNCIGIGGDLLDFVVDRSTVKQGLLTPGTHLEIRSPDELLARMPEYVVLLTWNFADEILEQQAEYRRRGGQFIIPLPRPRIV